MNTYHIYLYKQDLALNNLYRLICHKTPNKQTGYQFSQKNFSTKLNCTAISKKASTEKSNLVLHSACQGGARKIQLKEGRSGCFGDTLLRRTQIQTKNIAALYL